MRRGSGRTLKIRVVLFRAMTPHTESLSAKLDALDLVDGDAFGDDPQGGLARRRLNNARRVCQKR